MARRRQELAAAPAYPFDELVPLVRAALEAGAAVMLHGHPGVGKSTLAGEIAVALGLKVHDIRLAQRDPAELAGVFFPDERRQTLALLAPEWVRSAAEEPCMVFLDEINAAVTRLHQAAAYQIVLERRVGPLSFHPKTVVMAAGNLEGDEALVTPMSSALANRFVHFTLAVDMNAWLTWAEANGVSPTVVAYLRGHQRFGRALLYDNTGEPAFPSPRSWEMAARLFESAAPELRRRLVAAAVGPEAAEKFFSFVRLQKRTRPRAIVVQGKIPDFTGDNAYDPSLTHAVITAVASWLAEQPTVKDRWLPNIIRLATAEGLDPEYAFLLLRTLKARTDLTDRLKAVPGYRELAHDLVQLQVGLYQ